MIAAKAIKAIPYAGSTLKKGSEGLYMALTQDWGVKLYLNKDVAQILYMRQKFCARYNIAKPVGEFFSCQFQQSTWHGFPTKIVPTIAVDMTHEQRAETGDFKVETWGSETASWDLRAGHELLETLKSLGFCCYSNSMGFDLHLGNIGYDGRKLYVVDFGWGSYLYCGPMDTVEDTDIHRIIREHGMTIKEFMRAKC